MQVEIAGEDRRRIDGAFEQEQFPCLLQRRQIPAKSEGMLAHGLGPLFKDDQDARIAGKRSPVQKLQAKDALPTPRTAPDKRRPSCGDAAV